MPVKNVNSPYLLTLPRRTAKNEKDTSYFKIKPWRLYKMGKSDQVGNRQ